MINIFTKGTPYLGPSKNRQMYPYDEKRVRDEVIYLHSLWHQGPPPDPIPYLKNPNPRPSSSIIPRLPNPTPFYYTPNYPLYYQQSPNPNPRSYYPKPYTRNSLQPTNPTSFKKRVKKKKKMPLDSGPEWPCVEPLEPALEASGWPALKSVSTPIGQPLSAEERACFAAIQMQYKAAEACREFFKKRFGSNTDEDEDEDGNGDDEDDEMSEDGSEENEEFRFFFKMFVEDSELRSHFEKNYETGDFCCLVCRGIGKKGWKRFKGCVGLVQHSITISKTKRKRAHRAFGQVVCKVVGWDIDRFPTIILKDEPLGRSLAKPVELQGDPEGNLVIKENVVSANDGSGENAVSTDGCNGENAVYIDGENVVYVNGDRGENAGTNKAASSSTSLNTRKLDEETENLSRLKIDEETENLSHM